MSTPFSRSFFITSDSSPHAPLKSIICILEIRPRKTQIPSCVHLFHKLPTVGCYRLLQTTVCRFDLPEAVGVHAVLAELLHHVREQPFAVRRLIVVLFREAGFYRVWRVCTGGGSIDNPCLGAKHTMGFADLISQKVFIISSCKGRFLKKIVNVSFTMTNIKNKLTDLWGS